MCVYALCVLISAFYARVLGNMRAIIYANQSSYRRIRFVSRRAEPRETGTLVSIEWRGVSKSIGSSADDEPRGTNVGFAAAVAAWKVGLDQSGANEGVNGPDCLYLSLLPICVRTRSA